MVNMNKVLVISLFFALFYALPYACANEPGQVENEVQVWTFEVDDDNDTEEPPAREPVVLKECKEVILDEITPDYKQRFKYNIDAEPNIKPVPYLQKDTPTDSLNIKNGDFSLQSTSKKTRSDYFENALNQRTEAKYSKKYFEVSTGYETKYDNPDASQSSKNVFLAPKLKLNDEVSVIFNNKVDPMGTKFEQEVGLNFKPKFLPHSTFGVAGGTTVRNDSGERTQKMKFNTDLLLW